MPNWCSSFVSVEGSKKELDRFEKEIDDALSKEVVKTDFGAEWLGNLLIHIGVRTDTMRCRGEVTYRERISDNQYALDTESAWAPHLKCLEMFVKKYAPNAEIIYTAEESGAGLHITNDPDMAGKVMVEVIADETVPYSIKELAFNGALWNKDKLMERLREITGREETLIGYEDILADMIGENNWVSFAEYEMVPLSELD